MTHSYQKSKNVLLIVALLTAHAGTALGDQSDGHRSVPASAAQELLSFFQSIRLQLRFLGFLRVVFSRISFISRSPAE